MKDKITVEFNRKQLKQICKNHNLKLCKKIKCVQDDRKLIRCNLIFEVDYKIKEQNNGNN